MTIVTARVNGRMTAFWHPIKREFLFQPHFVRDQTKADLYLADMQVRQLEAVQVDELKLTNIPLPTQQKKG